MKLTRKFPIDVKPVRDGVYELLGDGLIGRHFSRWHHGKWRMTTCTPDEAVMQIDPSWSVELGKIYNGWRGLSSNHEERSK